MRRDGHCFKRKKRKEKKYLFFLGGASNLESRDLLCDDGDYTTFYNDKLTMIQLKEEEEKHRHVHNARG